MQLKYAENCRFATNAIITSPTVKMFSNDREIARGNRSKRNVQLWFAFQPRCLQSRSSRELLSIHGYAIEHKLSRRSSPVGREGEEERGGEGGRRIGEKRSFRVGTRATARGILRAHVNGRKAKRSSNVTRVSTVYSVKLSVHRP